MMMSGKIGQITLVATVVGMAGLARAEVGPDHTFLGSGVSPTNRSSICLGAFCNQQPTLFGAAQHFDCNRVGLSIPRDINKFMYNRSVRRTGDMSITRDLIRDANRSVRRSDDVFNPNLKLQFKIRPWEDFGLSTFPGIGFDYSGIGFDQDPIAGRLGTLLDQDSATRLMGDYSEEFETRYSSSAEMADLFINSLRKGSNSQTSSINVETPIGGLPDSLSPYVNQQYDLGGSTFSSLMFDRMYLGDVQLILRGTGLNYQNNFCRRPLLPTDPNYRRTGRHGGNSWGEAEDDQWAIKRVGLTDDEYSAWNLLPDAPAPVVVAVIDSGLDWHHLDISPENIWRNDKEDPNNGVDDDNNGYVDDVIGWNFIEKSNKPWDFDGHGTVVAGIIAAAHNDVGIAGVNPHARIMVLKAVNDLGTTRASFIAEAVVYAVDNGAQIINISVGGPHASRMEQAAIDYASQAGVLVVAAAGNDGEELIDFGPGGNDRVLTVGATHVDDRAAAFSNYGDQVDLVAPGVDVLSLRARYTDANYRPDVADNEEYTLGDNYVGADKRYLHVSGTSFSTPIVSGIASLLLSKNPEFTAADVERILTQTATDVEFPGKDKYTGHGMVNAQLALSVDQDFSITAEITSVELIPAEAPEYARVRGTIDASNFKRAWMQIGPGENPGGWRFVGAKRKFPIHDDELGIIPIRDFAGSELWQVVINVEHRNGVVKRAAFPVTVK